MTRNLPYLTCFGLLLAVIQPLAAEVQRPLLEKDGWSFGDEKAWVWKGTEKEPILSLIRRSDFKPKVRSPFNLAWFNAKKWGSFTLTADVRLDLFNKGNNDVCIAFGKQSDTKFYYAHLGQKADAVHLQLHLVDDADRRTITQKGAETLKWQPEKWHRVKLERKIDTRTIRVWFDDVEVLSATDKTLGEGMIGIGSFDDLGSFRNLEINRN